VSGIRELLLYDSRVRNSRLLQLLRDFLGRWIIPCLGPGGGRCLHRPAPVWSRLSRR